jgi:hypothetical protein
MATIKWTHEAKEDYNWSSLRGSPPGTERGTKRSSNADLSDTSDDGEDVAVVTPPKTTNVKWTPDELVSFLLFLEKQSELNWKEIKKESGASYVFSRRTGEQLRLKWRNLAYNPSKAGKYEPKVRSLVDKHGLPPWSKACLKLEFLAR